LVCDFEPGTFTVADTGRDVCGAGQVFTCSIIAQRVEKLRSATMENEPSSASEAGSSRRPSMLYATFAMLTLILAAAAVVAMVLRFGH
jgi:hypothetical protein